MCVCVCVCVCVFCLQHNLIVSATHSHHQLQMADTEWNEKKVVDETAVVKPRVTDADSNSDDDDDDDHSNDVGGLCVI